MTPLPAAAVALGAAAGAAGAATGLAAGAGGGAAATAGGRHGGDHGRPPYAIHLYLEVLAVDEHVEAAQARTFRGGFLHGFVGELTRQGLAAQFALGSRLLQGARRPLGGAGSLPYFTLRNFFPVVGNML